MMRLPNERNVRSLYVVTLDGVKNILHKPEELDQYLTQPEVTVEVETVPDGEEPDLRMGIAVEIINDTNVKWTHLDNHRYTLNWGSVLDSMERKQSRNREMNKRDLSHESHRSQSKEGQEEEQKRARQKDSKSKEKEKHNGSRERHKDSTSKKSQKDHESEKKAREKYHRSNKREKDHGSSRRVREKDHRSSEKDHKSIEKEALISSFRASGDSGIEYKDGDSINIRIASDSDSGNRNSDFINNRTTTDCDSNKSTYIRDLHNALEVKISSHSRAWGSPSNTWEQQVEQFLGVPWKGLCAGSEKEAAAKEDGGKDTEEGKESEESHKDRQRRSDMPWPSQEQIDLENERLAREYGPDIIFCLLKPSHRMQYTYTCAVCGTEFTSRESLAIHCRKPQHHFRRMNRSKNCKDQPSLNLMLKVKEHNTKILRTLHGGTLLESVELLGIDREMGSHHTREGPGPEGCERSSRSSSRDTQLGSVKDGRHWRDRSQERMQRNESCERMPRMGSCERWPRGGSHEKQQREGSYERHPKEESYERHPKEESYERHPKEESYEKGSGEESFDRWTKKRSYEGWPRERSYERRPREGSCEQQKSYDRHERDDWSRKAYTGQPVDLYDDQLKKVYGNWPLDSYSDRAKEDCHRENMNRHHIHHDQGDKTWSYAGNTNMVWAPSSHWNDDQDRSWKSPAQYPAQQTVAMPTFSTQSSTSSIPQSILNLARQSVPKENLQESEPEKECLALSSVGKVINSLVLCEVMSDYDAMLAIEITITLVRLLKEHNQERNRSASTVQIRLLLDEIAIKMNKLKNLRNEEQQPAASMTSENCGSGSWQTDRRK